jgi:thiol-disulfide isomerase/thioredoxin
MMPGRRPFMLGLMAAALVPGCKRAEERAATFPALALEPLDRAREAAALPAGPLVVNFWASWCAPCRREMASLERLSRRLEARVRVIGITADEDLNLAAEWLRKEGIGFANFADPALRRSREALAIDVLPQTLVVARDARIVLRVKGAREWDADDSLSLVLRALA